MSLTYRSYIGPEIGQVIDDIARLRIAVFRDWPYLYDGDAEYERRYLAKYARGDSIVVAAYDGNDMVGASTGMPLSDHSEEFVDSFSTYRIDFDKTFYCAESVLLSAFRGRGAGHVFFDRREDHARGNSYTFTTFCGVVRPDDHPARPADYKPLDSFWRGRGYAPLPGVIAQLSWRDIGAETETRKPLQFWGKAL